MKKQSSGLYRTKVTIGHDPEGKPIVKWISAKTKRELEDKKRETIAYYIEGTGRSGDELFAAYAQKWLDTYKSGKAPNTYRSYSNTLKNQLNPVFGDRNLRSISPTDIQQFMNTLEGRSTSLIDRTLSVINMIYKCALRDRIVDQNPAAYIEKPDAKEVKVAHIFSKSERQAIEDAIQSSKRDGLFAGMIYYTGMRIGEACGIQWGDIDWKNRMIHVQRSITHIGRTATIGKLKNTFSDRYIPIAPKLYDMLRAQPVGLPNALLFRTKHDKPLNYQSSRDKVLRILYAAGLAERIYVKKEKSKNTYYQSKITPHALRHNFITLCYEKGIDAFTASKLAGHANPQITLGIYTHLSKEHLQQDVAPIIDRLFG